jgi:hypothetical protein
MKATELRIGNYVNYNLGRSSIRQGVVRTINNVSCNITPINDSSPIDTVKFKSIEPIPLTEEWLKKFGFERRMINGKFWEYFRDCTPPNYKKDRRYVLRWWDFEEVQYGGRSMQWSPVLGGTIHEFPCKYVHQLQNLYHSLCGEELTVEN